MAEATVEQMPLQNRGFVKLTTILFLCDVNIAAGGHVDLSLPHCTPDSTVFIYPCRYVYPARPRSFTNPPFCSGICSTVASATSCSIKRCRYDRIVKWGRDK